MFLNPSLILESPRELHHCPAPSSLNELDFLEVGPRYLYIFQNFREFSYASKVKLAMLQLNVLMGLQILEKNFHHIETLA